MSNIKLKSEGNHPFITEPSGEKITASKLEVGKCYLYYKPYKYRKITDIIKASVYYESSVSPGTIGMCSASHFASLCPYEATQGEIDFLQKEYREQKSV